MLVEAALERDLYKALAALSSDPLAGRVETVRPMLEEMVEKARAWLP